MASATRRDSRPFELIRGAWGAALMIAPRTVMGRVHGIEIDRRGVIVARVLGARQVAQAVLSGVGPSPEVLAMGVWVDTVHAMSAIGLAVSDRSRARAGLTDAAVATVWAGMGLRDLIRAMPTPPGHQRTRDRLAVTVMRWAPGGKPLLRRAREDRRR